MFRVRDVIPVNPRNDWITLVREDKQPADHSFVSFLFLLPNESQMKSETTRYAVVTTGSYPGYSRILR